MSYIYIRKSSLDFYKPIPKEVICQTTSAFGSRLRGRVASTVLDLIPKLFSLFTGKAEASKCVRMNRHICLLSVKSICTVAGESLSRDLGLIKYDQMRLTSTAFVGKAISLYLQTLLMPFYNILAGISKEIG
jgi:hypothetical protein